MKKKPIIDETEIETIQVKLRPIAGVQPEQYIIPLYACIIVIILFLTLILPGMLKPGTHTEILASLDGASILLNDVRIGKSPLRIHLPAGDHKLTIRYPHYQTHEQNLRVHNSWFASIIPFPRKSLKVQLELSDAHGLWQSAISEFSQWSLSPNGALDYHVPPILVPCIRGILAHQNVNNKPATLESQIEYLIAAAAHIGNKSQLHDWLDAWKILHDHFSVTSNLEATRILAHYGLLQDGIYGPSIKIALDQDTIPQDILAMKPGTESPLPTTVRLLSGQGIRIQNASYSAVEGVYPKPVYIADQETTVFLYRQFLKAKPEWQREALGNLIRGEFCDENYLISLHTIDATDTTQAIREVSWHAVQAFMRWFNDTQLSDLANYHARLPRIQEWQMVDAGLKDTWSEGPWLSDRRNSSYEQQLFPLSHWRGGLFEWTNSPASIRKTKNSDYIRLQEQNPGFQRHLSGGSVMQDRPAFNQHPLDSWSWPASWSGESTGFRIWLFPKE
jgi:hypothetical protein